MDISLKRFVIRSSLLVIALWAPLGWAQPQTADIGIGLLELISAEKFDEAAQYADRVRAQPMLNSDVALVMICGAIYQEQARRTRDADVRAAAIEKSRRAYAQALTLRSGSGAILNNLALLEAFVGNDREARANFEAAVAAKDSRTPVYALNYAKYLSDRDIPQARRHAARALSASPNNETARELVLSLYRSGPRHELISFLAGQLDAGRTTLVLDISLAALGSDSSSSDSEHLLVLAAAAIAGDSVLLDNGPGAAALTKLNQLAQNGGLKQPASELYLALTGPPPSTTSLAWWTQRRDTPLVKRDRRAVMCALLRGLGEGHADTDAEKAERWLRLAIDIGDYGPDPDAFLRLVELYLNTNQKHRVDGLVGQYEGRLFDEKGGAYSRGDWASIYKLHLALGITYASMERWEGVPAIRTASFQLERANEAASRVASVKAMPAPATKALSDYYIRKGEPRRAVAMQLDVAKRLQESDRPNASNEVLVSVDPATVKAMGVQTEEAFRSLKANAERAILTGNR